MHRLFWVECPQCGARWYAEWELRYANVMLECFACDHKFQASEAKWLDERPTLPG